MPGDLIEFPIRLSQMKVYGPHAERQETFSKLVKGGALSQLKTFIATQVENDGAGDPYAVYASLFFSQDSEGRYLVQFADQAVLDYFYNCIEQCDISAQILLRWAVFLNQTKMIEGVCLSPDEIHETDQDGRTLFFYAVSTGCRSMAELLLKKGADVNRETSIQPPPLWIAVSHGNEPMVQLLMEHGADVHHTSKNRESAIWVAARLGHTSIFETLATAGVNLSGVNRDGETLLLIAVMTDQVAIAKRLLSDRLVRDRMDCPRTYGAKAETPVWAAVRFRRNSIFPLLCEAGADLSQTDAKGETLLTFASETGDVYMVRLLLEQESVRKQIDRTNNSGATALWKAARKGDVVVGGVLVAHGASVNVRINIFLESPFFVAAEKGHTAMARFLLEHGAYANSPNKYQITPLWIASQNGFDDIVAAILEHDTTGVNDKRKRTGTTPLYMAALKGHVNIAKMLIAHGATVNELCKKEKVNFLTPWGDIVDNGHLLLKRGETPLFIAACNGHDDMVELLLKKGADPLIMDKRGWRPADIAEQSGHRNLAKRLRSVSAAAKRKSSRPPAADLLSSGLHQILHSENLPAAPTPQRPRSPSAASAKG